MPDTDSREFDHLDVDRKESEITAAPRLLETIDLWDKVVSGDAMLTQRELSRQVVESGGDYLWSVKDNQPRLRDDLTTRFADASPSEPGLAATEERAWPH